MTVLRRLLSPEYWVVTEPGPLGALWVAYAVLGMAFLAGLTSACLSLFAPAAHRRVWGTDHGGPQEAQRLFACFEMSVTLAGLLAVVGRFLGWPGWSARIWPLSFALLALAGAAAYHWRGMPLPVWLRDLAYTLALLPPVAGPSRAKSRPESAAPPVGGGRRQPMARSLSSALGLCLHLLGIAFVLRARYGLAGWLSPLVLVALLTPQIGLVLRRQWPSFRPLAPMLAGYLVTLLWSLYYALRITVSGWQGLVFPDPMTSLFYVDALLLASIVYAWLCQLVLVRSSPHATLTKPQRRMGLRTWAAWRWSAALLLLATSTWAMTIYVGKRTHGATGSDPYAYAQMAVDLATRRTLLHRFALFQVVPQGIAWGPLLPDGYHLPKNEMGDSPSVWATGASVLLAGGYRLLGEAGLYLTTPVLALLALAAMWALVQEVLHGEPKATRHLTGALAVALTATSPEHVDRVLVPMADAPAQLFTVLTLLFVLLALRKLDEEPLRALACLALGGFCFAWAFWVRHTQLLLFVPIAVALLLPRHQAKQARALTSAVRSWRAPLHLARVALRGLGPLLVFATAALVMAIPDTLYRWRVFGGIFASETTELPSMALRNMGAMAWQMLKESTAAGEWGYLFPLAAMGCYFLARRQRRAFAMLSGAFLIVLLLHLTYRFLRLRDLISLFPLINIAVSYGAVSLAMAARGRVLRSHQPGRLGALSLGVGTVAWVVLAVSLARWSMIDDLWKPGWASFGYMRPDQRAAFDRLAELVPAESVIGASLSSGAVMMYTGRDAVRPYESWSNSDWATFVNAMWDRSRPVYLLDDSSVMAGFIRKQESSFRLVGVEALPIPLSDAQSRDRAWLYQVVSER